MARSNDLSEWEKIVKDNYEKVQRLNTKYCQLCGKELLALSSLTPEQREFQQRNGVHYDCAIAYQRKKQEKLEKEALKRKQMQEKAKKEEEYKARVAAQEAAKKKDKEE